MFLGVFFFLFFSFSLFFLLFCIIANGDGDVGNLGGRERVCCVYVAGAFVWVGGEFFFFVNNGFGEGLVLVEEFVFRQDMFELALGFWLGGLEVLRLGGLEERDVAALLGGVWRGRGGRRMRRNYRGGGVCVLWAGWISVSVFLLLFLLLFDFVSPCFGVEFLWLMEV